ncbi:MAG TPA: TolC family protein [Chitinophagaceae bacterium]|nr:TolC family protein [Chitinophagaceae bacterium]
MSRVKMLLYSFLKRGYGKQITSLYGKEKHVHCALLNSSTTDERIATQRSQTGVTHAGIKIFINCLVCLLLSQVNNAQRISFTALYDTALKNNLLLRSSDLGIAQSRALAGTANAIPKTGIFAENEDTRPSDSKGILKIGLSQDLDWPGVYKARKTLLQQQLASVELAKGVRVLDLKRDVQSAYYNLWYLQSRQGLWQRLDSIYSSLAQAAFLRVRTGESAGLDSIAASAKAQEVLVQVQQIAGDIRSAQELLKKYAGTSNAYLPEQTPLQKVVFTTVDTFFDRHPQLQYQQQNISVAGAEIGIQQQSRKPTFSGRFFTQRLYGISDPFSGFSVSVGLPFIGGTGYRNKIKAAEIGRSYQESLYAYERLSLRTAFIQAYEGLKKDEELLRYYESTGLAQADAIMKAANIAYRAGEISFAELSGFLTQSIDIQKNYLEVLNKYNQSAIELNYLKGN